MNGEFVTFYPGVYTEREEKYLKGFRETCRVINERGPVDILSLVKNGIPEDMPGVYSMEAEEAMVRYNALKYAPDEPMYSDAEYAKKLGFPALPALPTYAAHDDSFMAPWPPEARDYMLVSGLNNEVRCHRPICVGDTLYIVVDRREVIDLTPPEGSVFRSVAIESEGSIYNQRGELVNTCVFRVVENVKSYVDPADMPEGAMFWIGPDWGAREDHYYTDADWEKILDIWKNEKRQGAEPLYWEDVPVGFEPAATLDGPVDDSVEPAYRYGMGLGGTRTLRREIMDENFRRTMTRGSHDGIYRMPVRTDAWPVYPDYAKIKYGVDVGGGVRSVDLPGDDICPRFIFINFMGRDYALRHIMNFMGEHGKLLSIKWGIMSPDSLAAVGYKVPGSPNAVDFLEPVPYKKGRPILIHGMERDVMWVKSYVYAKRVEEGRHLVELAWWIDTIDGQTFESGQATVELPSRG